MPSIIRQTSTLSIPKAKMHPRNYAKPPIVEAVIELRFDPGMSESKMAKYVREVRANYPNATSLYEVEIKIDASSTGEPLPNAKQRLTGHKIVGRDETDVIMLSTRALGTVRLAPYEGWNAFLAKAKANYEPLKKITGYRKLVRLATRYTNRLDIPRHGRESINTTDYLLAEPIIPKIFPSVQAFLVQFLSTVPKLGAQVLVNAATVNSPLIDHFSLLLDIDLYIEQNLPQKETEIWELLGELQAAKNALFEDFITDNARALFDHG